MKEFWREIILVLVIVGTLVLVMFLEPIPQDPAYHNFADQRSVLGVPNFSHGRYSSRG